MHTAPDDILLTADTMPMFCGRPWQYVEYFDGSEHYLVDFCHSPPHREHHASKAPLRPQSPATFTASVDSENSEDKMVSKNHIYSPSASWSSTSCGSSISYVETASPIIPTCMRERRSTFGAEPNGTKYVATSPISVEPWSRSHHQRRMDLLYGQLYSPEIEDYFWEERRSGQRWRRRISLSRVMGKLKRGVHVVVDEGMTVLRGPVYGDSRT